ncbi:hypothetical protein DVH05_020076 [Phytophthora capsici]|nr:hypothetical protein DVH05_020075 [Phytophthora capsici]KAG1709421.1 hypothetical protein DVH05_020076 [Phytophthora capsici]
MRLNLAVLAAVIALVSRCTAVSAASSTNQINLSNLNQALNTMPNHAGDGNRLLRTAKIVDDSEDDIDSDDDIDRDEEERGGKTWAEKFAKWHARGESADDVYQRFALEPVVRQAYKYGQIGRLDDNEYYRKWAAYSAYLKDKGLN